jgi:hypothetical protein
VVTVPPAEILVMTLGTPPPGIGAPGGGDEHVALAIHSQSPSINAGQGRDNTGGRDLADTIVERVQYEQIARWIHGHAPRVGEFGVSTPVPATVVMIPPGETRHTQWLLVSAIKRLLALSTARPDDTAEAFPKKRFILASVAGLRSPE